MKPADRIALTERLARAMAWNALTQDQRNTWARNATETVKELETAYEQNNRIGWVLIDVDSEPEPVE